MPEVIISASGPQYGLVINSDGSVNVSGTFTAVEQPLGGGYNYETELLYLTSGTAVGVTGSEIGSIIKHHLVGSVVRILTYSNNQLVNVGSWS